MFLLIQKVFAVSYKDVAKTRQKLCEETGEEDNTKMRWAREMKIKI